MLINYLRDFYKASEYFVKQFSKSKFFYHQTNDTYIFFTFSKVILCMLRSFSFMLNCNTAAFFRLNFVNRD